MWRFVSIFCVVSASAKYSGHKILEVRLQNEKHLSMSQKLIGEDKTDILSVSPEQYSIMIPPHFNLHVSSLLKGVACEFTLSPINTEKDINEEAERLSKRSPDFNYTDYNDFNTFTK